MNLLKHFLYLIRYIINQQNKQIMNAQDILTILELCPNLNISDINTIKNLYLEFLIL